MPLPYKGEIKSAFVPIIRDKGAYYLCGTTLVPCIHGTRFRVIGRTRRSLLTPKGCWMRGSGVIQENACLLPCTIRQLSVGGGLSHASPS